MTEGRRKGEVNSPGPEATPSKREDTDTIESSRAMMTVSLSRSTDKVTPVSFRCVQVRRVKNTRLTRRAHLRPQNKVGPACGHPTRGLCVVRLWAPDRTGGVVWGGPHTKATPGPTPTERDRSREVAPLPDSPPPPHAGTRRAPMLLSCVTMSRRLTQQLTPGTQSMAMASWRKMVVELSRAHVTPPSVV